MTSFGQILARIVVAGSLVAIGAVAVEAAGALAVGSCGAYGFAYDYRQPEIARTAALGKCAGGDCKVVTAMKRACAALAIDVTNACGALGYASAGGLGQAQNTALRQCYRYGGKDCVIRAFVCDAKG
jgi:Domain of unknown function (DUF4189)